MITLYTILLLPFLSLQSYEKNANNHSSFGEKQRKEW